MIAAQMIQEYGAAAKMKTLWSVLLLILSALIGGTVTELTDDKIDIPILEKPETPEKICPDAIILAYTADGEKHICECVGAYCPCTNTEEILSQLG